MAEYLRQSLKLKYVVTKTYQKQDPCLKITYWSSILQQVLVWAVLTIRAKWQAVL